MRKLDREAKANKRLSQEAEELTWRLSLGEMSASVSGAPLYARQVSRSPPGSASQTPEPPRRGAARPAAAPSSPRATTSKNSDMLASSPRSSLELERTGPRSPRSPNGKVPPRSPTSKNTHHHDPPKDVPVPPFTKILRSPDEPVPARGFPEVSEEEEQSAEAEGGSSTEAPRGTLKRSGTYDLLDQRGRSSDEEDGGSSRHSHTDDSLQEDLAQHAAV